MLTTSIERIELAFWKTLNHMMSESYHLRLFVKYIIELLEGETQIIFVPAVIIAGVFAFSLGMIITLVMI